MKKRYIIAFIITLGILWLTSPYWLIYKTKSDVHIEFIIFTIIFICGYLLSQKIIGYLASLKTLKSHSRIEIIFLTIFFGMLFAPMCHIDVDSVKSETENRNLAKYKPLFERNNKINYNFGNDFDEWFNDRFYLRENLIDLYYNLKYFLANDWLQTNSAIYNKKTHWAFRNSQITYYNKFYDTDFINDTAKNLNKFYDFCNLNNIKLYVLIVPYNVEVYYDKVPKYIHNNIIQYKKNYTISEIIKQTKANVIYPYNELRKASKTDIVYYKTDHHWTNAGAAIGYSELLKHIKKDFPQLKDFSESDYKIFYSKRVKDLDDEFTVGERISKDFPFLQKYENKILDTNYKYYINKNEKLLKTKSVWNTKIRKKEFYYPYGANLKVLQIGTSMNDNLVSFTPYSFKHLTYIRLNGVKNRKIEKCHKIMKYYKGVILKYKPDIIIFCIAPNNLLYSKDWFEGE